EAEAVREKRARIIKAEAEQEAAQKLSDGARQMGEQPLALELRRMQMITEVGAEKNSTTIMLMPSDFVNLANGITRFLDRAKARGGAGGAGAPPAPAAFRTTTAP